MKISIIGAGNVGASIAYALGLRNVCDEISLVDIFADTAKAKAMDIEQSAIVLGCNTKVKGSDSYELINDSDIVVITAGSPRKQGESRQDLLIKNAKVVSDSAKHIAKHAPKSIIIVVTNPLDEMTYVAFNASGFDKSRVIGMAGELDTARLKYELSQVSTTKPSKISSYVVGSHNDKMKVVKNGCEISSFETASSEAKKGGAKIVALLGTSAYYAPAAGVVKLCEAIKNDSKEIQSICVIDGDIAIGLRAKIDKNGICEILACDEDLSESKSDIAENLRLINQNLI